jgi:hypothetical protein
MTDDILLQEIFSLREKLKVAAEIVRYYEPDTNLADFQHDIGTEDFLLYLEENEKEDYLATSHNRKRCENILKNRNILWF